MKLSDEEFSGIALSLGLGFALTIIYGFYGELVVTTTYLRKFAMNRLSKFYSRISRSLICHGQCNGCRFGSDAVAL